MPGTHVLYLDACSTPRLDEVLQFQLNGNALSALYTRQKSNYGPVHRV